MDELLTAQKENWEKAFKKATYLMSLLDFLCFVVCFFFIPLAKTGPVSLFTTFELLKGLFSDGINSYSYIPGSSMVFIIAIAYTAAFLIAPLLYISFVKKAKIIPNDAKTIKGRAPNNVIANILITTLLLIPTFFENTYMFSFPICYVMALSFLIIEISKNIIYKRIDKAFLKEFPIENPIEDEILHDENLSMNNPTKTEKKQSKKSVIIAWALFISVGVIVMFLPKLLSNTSAPEYETGLSVQNTELDMFGISKDVGKYLANTYDGYYDSHTHTYILDKHGKIEITTKTTQVKIYSDNYKYYEEKIKELEKEASALMPDDGDSFNDYKEKLDKYAADIKYLKQILKELDYYYSEMRLEKGKLISYSKNYSTSFKDENGYKWHYYEGASEDEKIELSKTDFAQGTDFAEEEIIASVYYGDGSFRKSVITVTNASELVGKSGTQVIKWSDSWGNYEATIFIG